MNPGRRKGFVQQMFNAKVNKELALHVYQLNLFILRVFRQPTPSPPTDALGLGVLGFPCATS